MMTNSLHCFDFILFEVFMWSEGNTIERQQHQDEIKSLQQEVKFLTYYILTCNYYIYF